MLSAELATAAIAVLSGGALALYVLPDGRGCPECSHCRRTQEARELEQRLFRHDLEHKGWGFGPRTPDRYRCSDERCPRNSRLALPVSAIRTVKSPADADRSEGDDPGGPGEQRHRPVRRTRR